MINHINEIETVLKKAPTTRYQGSKRRLLPWLYEIFSELEFESVLDGFGGSASASYLFKLMGKQVYYNDILKSNYQTGIAFIENSTVVLSNTDIELLLEPSDAGYPSLIADTFKDIYYYSSENNWLDMMVFNIRQLSQFYKGIILKRKQALAFHSLFQACLSKRPYNLFHRKNLNLRQAQVPRTFGNKVTWDLEFSHLFKKFALESSSKVFSNNQRNKASCADVLLLKNRDYDLVYLDPPYQRPSESHPKDYYSLYHFLEGLVDYDNWSSRIDFTEKHLPLRKKSSEYDRMLLLDRFDIVLKRFSESIIAISYGDPGKPTISEITELLSRYKSKITIFDTPYVYKLNRRNGNRLREVLIIGF